MLGADNERGMVELNREVVELKTMMGMVLQSVRDLQTDLKAGYVTKAEYEELRRHVDNMQTAPHKWISTVIAIAAVIVAYFKH